MDKAKSTPMALAGLKKEKPVEKEVEPIEIKEKTQPVPVPIQKKKVNKKEEIQEQAKPMNLGFGPLGPLGGSSASSIPSEDQSANSNFF